MKLKGFNVKEEAVEQINDDNIYDGIWACASLLHVRRENLEKVIKKCIKALNKNGILYCSFKYGDKEIKGERYFNYINEIYALAMFSLDKANNVIKASIRSRGPVINEIASHFNGGGHALASGARLKDFNEVDKLVLELDEACRVYTSFIKETTEE